MKKIIMTAVVFMGLTATAQVKVGSDVQNLATNANFQVEGGALATANPEQFVVLKNGFVGIGTTTPNTPLHIFGNPTGNAAQLKLETTKNNGNCSYITFDKKRGVSGAVQSGDELGFLDFRAWDGTSSVRSALIYSTVEGTPSAGNVGGNLAFYTTQSGGAFAERMKIANNGNVSIVNTPTITTATKVLVKEPVTNVISEQVVNGNSVSTTAVAAGTTVQGFVGGNAEFSAINTGVIMRSPNGDKWKVTVGDGGVLTIVKAL